MSSGYEVAWKMVGADLYTVWNTDSSGNYVSNATGIVSGGSAALEALEPSFQQDLNNDGTTGPPPPPPPIVIESFGATDLDQVGSNYALYAHSTTSGPLLQYQGAAVMADQFGGWRPIGGEATASGYEVAWKMAGADLYTVWNTDSDGRYINHATGVVPGASAELEALEPSFQQDLNDDGTIGIPTTATEAVQHFDLLP
jgi:serralysin